MTATMSSAMPSAEFVKSMPGASAKAISDAAFDAAWVDPANLIFASVFVVGALVATMFMSDWYPWRTRVDPDVHKILDTHVDPAVREIRRFAAMKVLAGDETAQQVLTECLAQREAIVAAGKALRKLPPHESERAERIHDLHAAGKGVEAAVEVIYGLYSDAKAQVEVVGNDRLVEEEITVLQSQRLQEVLGQARGRLAENSSARREVNERLR